MASGQRRPRLRSSIAVGTPSRALRSALPHNLRAGRADYSPRRYNVPSDAVELSAISEPDLSEPCYGTDHQTVGPERRMAQRAASNPSPVVALRAAGMLALVK